MFEENVIDGVLSFKLVENGQFIEYTPKQLSAMLIESRKRESDLRYVKAIGKPIDVYPSNVSNTICCDEP